MDRAKLNEDLLDAAGKFQNVKIYFEHLFKRADLDKGTLEFETCVEYFFCTQHLFLPPFFSHSYWNVFLHSSLYSKNSRNGELVTFESDFIIGADGAYSAVRNQLMRKVR